MKNKNPNGLDVYSTTDQYLVELAGLHVYLKLNVGVRFEVNGKPFIVRNSNIDKDKTGLDAIILVRW